MSQHVPAGWYPDYSDPTQQRYWDGVQWTQHTAPVGGPAAVGPDPAIPVHAGPGYGQAPGASYAQAAAPSQPLAQSYPQSPPPGYDQGQQPYDLQAYAQPQQPHGPPRSGTAGSGGDGSPKNLWIIVIGSAFALVVLIALIVIGVRLFSDTEAQPGPAPTVAPTNEPADVQPEPASEPVAIELEDELIGSLEQGGTWAGTLSLDQDDMVVINVIGIAGDADLTVELLDDSGRQIASNDDRALLSRIVGNEYRDPYLALWLEEGEYTVVVGSFLDLDAGEFAVAASVANPLPEELEIDLPDHAYLGRVLEVREQGEYTITAVAEEHWAAIGLIEANGSEHTLANDYTSEAVLTADLDEGHYMVVIADPTGEPDTLTVTVEGP